MSRWNNDLRKVLRYLYEGLGQTEYQMKLRILGRPMFKQWTLTDCR